MFHHIQNFNVALRVHFCVKSFVDLLNSWKKCRIRRKILSRRVWTDSRELLPQKICEIWKIGKSAKPHTHRDQSSFTGQLSWIIESPSRFRRFAEIIPRILGLKSDLVWLAYFGRHLDSRAYHSGTGPRTGSFKNNLYIITKINFKMVRLVFHYFHGILDFVS